MLSAIFILSAVVGQASAASFPSSWKEFEASADAGSMEKLFGRFQSEFGREFASKVEEAQHFKVFSERVAGVFDFNAQDKVAYKKGINKFSDMDGEARRSFVMAETLNDAKRLPRSSKGSSNSTVATDLGLTKQLNGAGDSTTCDLRPFSTPVKDQASCGSCWAFGTMAAAEASHFLWGMVDGEGDAISLTDNAAWQVSEQVLVDCCDTCNGCGGGGTFEPMQCAVDMGTLPSTISHAYSATDGNTCEYSTSEAVSAVSNWFEPCSSGDEACLKNLIGGDDCTHFFTTALKTSIEVVDSFYDYTDGIYSDPACPNDKHNHAVAIVGWGTDAATGVDYWIMRNSWGESWGMGGYFYMERGVNMCCVACENLFFQ